MKVLLRITILLLALTGFTFAGGKGGTEVALASYNGIGGVLARGIPLDVTFLSANGIQTYGELEIAAGLSNEIAASVELAGGVLLYMAPGLSFYGSLGPAIGLSSLSAFDLAGELGLNIDVNRSAIIVEIGSHPTSNYLAVGLKL